MKLHEQPITKDIIAQHDLTDNEHRKALDILGCELNAVW